MNRTAQHLASLMIGAILLSTPAWALASPPTDEEVAAAVETFMTEVREHRDDAEARLALADSTFGGFDFSRLTLDQLRQLRMVAGMLPARQLEQARQRIDSLASDSGSDGFAAAVLRIAYFAPQRRAGMDEEAMRQALQDANTMRSQATIAVLRHPWLHEALLSDQAGEVLSLIGRLRGDDLAEVRDELLALKDVISADMPAPAFARLTGYYQAITSDATGIEAGDRERIRKHLVAVAEQVSERLKREQASVERTRDFLDGAFARGKLVDHRAPEMEFIWSSTETPLTSLADLRGNVVVIDFWATWCGPCIASFPQVRELVAHYDGYPVIILGVTSLQGRHIARKAGERGMERIDTSDDPKRELALMEEFMSDMDMTWPVVFSTQNVYNPDFGVRGIPNVAIIDPAGKVRYHGLHPALPQGRALQDKAEKIDGLLREFNLRAPPPPPPPEAEAEAASAADM